MDFRDSEAYKQAEQNANLAGRYAQEGLPEESLRYGENMANRAIGSAISSTNSLRGLGNVGALSTSLSDQYRDLAQMDANARVQQRAGYLQQLGLLQQAQQQAFDIDMGYDNLERSRLLGEMAAGRAMFNQGLQNIAKSGETFGNAMGGSFGGGGGSTPNQAPTVNQIDAWNPSMGGGASGGYYG